MGTHRNTPYSYLVLDSKEASALPFQLLKLEKYILWDQMWREFVQHLKKSQFATLCIYCYVIDIFDGE